MSTVNWTACAQAIEKLDWSKWVHVIKFSHQWLATAVRLARHKDVTLGNGLPSLWPTTDGQSCVSMPQSNQWKTKFHEAMQCHLDKWQTAADILSPIIPNSSWWLHNNIDKWAGPQDAVDQACFFQGHVATDPTQAQSCSPNAGTGKEKVQWNSVGTVTSRDQDHESSF